MKPLSIATLSALFSLRSPQEKQEKQSENAAGGDMSPADAFSDLMISPGESSAPAADAAAASLRVLRWAGAQGADGLDGEAVLSTGDENPAPEGVAAGAPARISPSETVLNWRNSLRAAIEGEEQVPETAAAPSDQGPHDAPPLTAEEPASDTETPELLAVHRGIPDESFQAETTALPPVGGASKRAGSGDTETPVEKPETSVGRRISSFTANAPDQTAAAMAMEIAPNGAEPAPVPVPEEDAQRIAPSLRRIGWAAVAEQRAPTGLTAPADAQLSEAALIARSGEGATLSPANSVAEGPRKVTVSDASHPGWPARTALDQPATSPWPLRAWRATPEAAQDTSGEQAAETPKPYRQTPSVAEDRQGAIPQMSAASRRDLGDKMTSLQGEIVLKPVAANPEIPKAAAPTEAFVGALQPDSTPTPVDGQGDIPTEASAAVTETTSSDAWQAQDGKLGRTVPNGETGMATAPAAASTSQADESEAAEMRSTRVTEATAPAAVSEADIDHGEIAPPSHDKVSDMQPEVAQADTAKPNEAPRGPVHEMTTAVPQPLGVGESGRGEPRADSGMASATSSAATHRAGAAHGLGHQVADALVNTPNRAVELTLSPEELGKVRMTLHAQEGSMTVAVQAERPETLDLMRRHIDSLAREFREMGYADVSFDFGQQSNQQPKPQEQLVETLRAQEGSPSGPFQSAAITAPGEVEGAAGGLDLRM